MVRKAKLQPQKPRAPTKAPSIYVGFKENDGIIVKFIVDNELGNIDFARKRETELQKQKAPKLESARGFDQIIKTFTNSLNALQTGTEVSDGTFGGLASFVIKIGPEEFCKKHGVKLDSQDGTIYQLPLDKYGSFQEASEMFWRLRAFKGIQPRLHLIGLVSLYDGYLSNLIEMMFKQHPSMLDASEKTMRYKDVVELGGLEEAANFIIKKEVETVIRDSHTAHFDWLASKLKTKLTDGLGCWPNFVEVCERRNLFTHANGVVSDQYMKNCLAVGYALDPAVKSGSQLDISREYLAAAIDTFYEVGIKLGYVIWRKMKTKELEEADKSLSNAAYELICRKKYKLAQRLLEFASEMPKVQDGTKKMMKVNLANAHKLDGSLEKAEEILDKIDWSASGLDFQVSVAAVLNRFDRAAELMLKIGKNGSVEKLNYHEWPVFDAFRKTDQFKKTYKRLFGVTFEVDEIERQNADIAQADVSNTGNVFH